MRHVFCRAQAVISLDPGIRGCGVGYWGGTTLRAAEYVRNPIRHGNSPVAIVEMARAIRYSRMWEMRWDPAGLAVEYPQIYAERHQKGNQDDILPLVGIGMALAALYAETGPWPLDRYLPHEWKGSINADVMIGRVKARLTKGEWAVITFPENTCADCRNQFGSPFCRKSTCLAHNVFDAIGIGLFHLGRLEKRRVIAR
jgi:hypothetical protein